MHFRTSPRTSSRFPFVMGRRDTISTLPDRAGSKIHAARQGGMRTVVLGLLLCCAAQAAITKVQQVTGGVCTGFTCTATVAPTGSGHILIAMFALMASGSPVTGVSGGGTWVQAPKCAVGSGTSYVDCWYVLSSTAGATAVTGTFSTTGSGRAVEFYEFSPGAGCFAVYDKSNSANNSSSTASPGIALAQTGANDVIVQGIYTNAAISSINSGYTAAVTGTNRTAASSPARRCRRGS